MSLNERDIPLMRRVYQLMATGKDRMAVYAKGWLARDSATKPPRKKAKRKVA